MSKLNNFIALDISDNSLEVMECQRDFWGRYVIRKINRLALERGVIVGGDIKNANALVKSLKKLLKTAKPSSISSTNCLLSIPENKVFTHIFYVPVGLKNDDIEDFLLNQAEGIIPFNRETIISDYQIVDTVGKEKMILYAAAPKKLIADVLAVLRKLKVNVLLIELESISVARSLLSKPISRDSNMVLDIGGNYSNITIYDKQGLKLTVSLPLAGNQFTKEIGQKTKLTVEKATELKMKKGLNSTNKQAVAALQVSLDKIIEEITRSINYFEKKSGQIVKRLILVGGSAKLPGIVEYLSSKVKIEIIAGNSWHRVKKSPEILNVFKKKDGLLYSTVIGLMLRGGQKNYKTGLNLLPDNVRKGPIIQLSSGNRKDWIKYVIFALILVGLGLLLVFKDDIRGDHVSPTVIQFDGVERRVTLVVGYADGFEANPELSQIGANIISQSGEAQQVWNGITTSDLSIFADDYLTIANDSDAETTLVANSRLSMGDDIFYLAKALRLESGGSDLVRVIRKDDQPVKLEIGTYNFMALPKVRQTAIYGIKAYEFNVIPPEQISQVDVSGIAQVQEGLRYLVEKNSSDKLPEGIYVDRPLSSEVGGISYLRIDEDKIGLKMIADYQWIQLDLASLIDLSVDKLNGEVTRKELELVLPKVIKKKDNKQEEIIEIEVLWIIEK